MKHYLGISQKMSSSHGKGRKDNWLLGLTTSIFYSHDSLWCYIEKGALTPVALICFISKMKMVPIEAIVMLCVKYLAKVSGRG